MDWVKAKIQQTRLHIIEIQEQKKPPVPLHQPGRNPESAIGQLGQTHNSILKLVLLGTCLVSGAVIVIVVWTANLIDFEGAAETNQSPKEVSAQIQQPVELRAGYTNSENKSDERSDENRSGTVSRIDTLPPPSAGNIDRKSLAHTDTVELGNSTGSSLQTKSTQSTADVNLQRQESSRAPETWAINLASLKRKVDAENFAAKANHKGVAAEINKVMVRGTTYWRVQLPGFSSADEARTKVTEVQEKLGLKDVWILKR